MPEFKLIEGLSTKDIKKRLTESPVKVGSSIVERNSLETTPLYMPLTPEIFPQGSLGREVFPEAINGKVRSLLIFNQPISAVCREGSKIYDSLTGYGFDTVGDLLSVSFDDMQDLPYKYNVRAKLGRFLDGLESAPQLVLMSFVYYPFSFYGKLRELTPDKESALIEALAAELNRLPGTAKDAVIEGYGFRDGVAATITEVASRLGLSYNSAYKQYEETASELRRSDQLIETISRVLRIPTSSISPG